MKLCVRVKRFNGMLQTLWYNRWNDTEWKWRNEKDGNCFSWFWLRKCFKWYLVINCQSHKVSFLISWNSMRFLHSYWCNCVYLVKCLDCNSLLNVGSFYIHLLNVWKCWWNFEWDALYQSNHNILVKKDHFVVVSKYLMKLLK